MPNNELINDMFDRIIEDIDYNKILLYIEQIYGKSANKQV